MKTRLLALGLTALTLGVAAGTASAATVTWGVVDGDWDTITANWLDDVSAPTTFTDGDDARFDNTSGGSINIVGTVAPLSTIFSAASGTYTINGAGLGGTGSLTKDGGGTLLLTADNTFTGGTIINSGTLRFNLPANAALGTGPVTLNGGTLYLWRVYPTNSLVVNGGKIFSSNGFGNSWNGPVTLNADLTVEPQYRITFSATISGPGGLTVDNQNNTVVLTGANDYTGDTTVNQGTLRINGNSINDANRLTINGGKVQPIGTETVDTLYFGTLQQESGTWGASGSGAEHTNDVRFTGSAGVVNVITGLPMNEADILVFGLPGYPGIITGTNIAWTVPGTFDVTDLSPTFTLSYGAIATPASGTSRDFTTPQTYSVDSGDGTLLNKIYVVTVTQSAVPSTFTWASAVMGNWSDASKWSNDLATGTGPGALGGSFYTLNFTQTGTYTATHDLNDGFLLNQLNFGGTVTLAGDNSLALTADETTPPEINQNSGNEVTINLPLELAADTTFGGSGGGWAHMANVISGIGSLTKNGPGTLRVHGVTPNTFAGGTVINSGTLLWGTMVGGSSPPINAALGTGPVTVNPGATLHFERVDNATNNLILNGGTVRSGNGWGAKWSGSVTLTTNSTIDATWGMTFSGNISGTGGMTKTGNNTLKLSGSNDYTGDTTVNTGTLETYGSSISDAGKLIIDGGKVKPNGTETVDTLYFGTLQQESGTWGATGSGAEYTNDVRFTGSAGVVNVITGLPMNEADIVVFGLPGYPGIITGTNIAWTVPGTFDVTDLSPTFTLSYGAIATPVSGTSRDFTTPQTYSVDSGDGTILNKVYVVTVTQSAVPSTFTWASAVTGNWSDASKWSNDLATGTGPGALGGSFYTLNFTQAGTYTATHDLNDGFLLNQLNFGGTVTLAGDNSLALTTDETTPPEINQNSGNQVTINLPLVFAADTTFGGTGGGWLNLYNEISGTGSLIKNGSSTLRLKDANNVNSYSGGTIINSGTLRLDYAGSDYPVSAVLGTGPVTLNGGTLYLWRVYPTNSLVVNGGKVLSSNGFGNSWNGPVTLNADLTVEPQYRITFSATISGPGGLTVDNQNNTVVLTGANDYTGDTTVNQGTLAVSGNSINDEGTLIIDGGIVKPTGTETVYMLYFGTEKQEIGTWGATGSGAEHIDDVRFTGTDGVVQVVGAPRGTSFIIR